MIYNIHTNYKKKKNLYKLKQYSFVINIYGPDILYAIFYWYIFCYIAKIELLLFLE